MKLPVLNAQQTERFEFQSLKDRIQPIYLDNNATTQTDEDAIDAMIRSMEVDYANPSAIHEAGTTTARKIEDARTHVAAFIGCAPDEVIFTSSGTESINSVINSVIKANTGRNHIITCLTEHNATLNALKALSDSYVVSYLEVDRNGQFLLGDLEKLLVSVPNSNLLLTLMAVNNETGTIHTSLHEAIELAHKYNSFVHIDAVQAAGKVSLKQYIDAGADYLSISGHKFHAPKGIGAIYIKQGSPFSPIFFGGNQEYGLRAGTENIPAIIGLGVVAKKMPVLDDKMTSLHDLFIDLLLKRIPSCRINGGGLPGTVNVGFRYVHREAMVVKLSTYELYASIGSSCSAGIEPSHVLKAMKVPQEYIHGSVRFSMSKHTTENEIRRAIDIIGRAYDEIRALSKGVVA